MEVANLKEELTLVELNGEKHLCSWVQVLVGLEKSVDSGSLEKQYVIASYLKGNGLQEINADIPAA